MEPQLHAGYQGRFDPARVYSMPGPGHTHTMPGFQEQFPHHRAQEREIGGAIEAHVSLVGQPGMPEPVQRPAVAKAKFTGQDDDLLRILKEQKKLSWRQIADFFPGRSSGTLQVRYCTKLRKKEAIWDEDSLYRLRIAVEDYERDKWKYVAAKVGTGFSRDECEAKWFQLEQEEEEASTKEDHSRALSSHATDVEMS